MFDASGAGLEIGAGYNPILPKAEGWNVETLDHGTQAELRAKYAADPSADEAAIEPVDHVSDGRSMADVIGRKQAYDFIVASHVIEHAPDILGFLSDCETLLKPDGVLVLAVPDMRYCFDRYRPRSSLGAVIEAHQERRRRHTRASLFDRVAYNNRLDDRAGWSKGCEGTYRLQFDLLAAPAFAARYNGDAYVDNHGWQFTPSSFRGLVEDLFSLGMIGLREARFEETPIFEFFIILSTSGKGPGRSRVELLETTLDEQAETSSSFRSVKREAIELAAENQRLRSENQEAAAVSGEIDRLKAALAKRDRLQAELEHRMRALQEGHETLLGSKSWRVTRPLRVLSRRLKQSLTYRKEGVSRDL